jgi:signal peptidase I
LDPRVREVLKYGVAFAVLMMVFFGGSYVLKGVLGTEYPMMVVVSQSMVPTLGVGDYIIVAKIPDVNQITVGSPPEGDIIVFLKPGSTDEYIVHRAIRRIDSNGGVYYTTKGDNNAFPDGTPVPLSNIMGKVVGNVPIIGYFSLFIKTMRGFGLVITFMGLTFFIDYILPAKKPGAGHFPILSLIPLLVAPLAVASFWFIPSQNQTQSQNVHLILDNVSIVVWYLACLIVPLAFHDDDSGAMIWLYHLVLVMLPIACDVTWWTNKITPSMWFNQSGGTISINWFLLTELPSFNVVFESVLRSLVPGVVIFVVALYAKRKGWEPFASWESRLRGARPEQPATESQPEAPATPDAAEAPQRDPTPPPAEPKPENA